MTQGNQVLISEERAQIVKQSADLGPSSLDLPLRLDEHLGLKAAGLFKSFTSPTGKPIEVLRGVSFSVAPGEAVAIRGASGAGKSTLLHLLGGLEKADEGNIQLGTFDVTGTSSGSLAQFRNNEVGFVFQFHHLLPDLTAAENVALPLLISRTSKREGLERAVFLLEDLGLRERAHHPIRHLSGGEQQRVAIARALVKEPRLVLADEPTGNLDTGTGDEIAASLLAYSRSRRASLVIATHNERLARLCDRTLVLAEGKLTRAGCGEGNRAD
ncbi:MAG: ABC transporter ATP-binding protein [Pyrinomonadaceae bacterium]